MIESKDVCLRYTDGTMALKDINLSVDAGEMVYITGVSGSGKTSLLKLFMGVEFPTTGSLNVLGHNMTKGNSSNIRKLRTRIGPVFQEFRLIKGRTALDNVMLGMRFLDLSPSLIREAANDALVKVGLKHKLLSPVENLSWGEGQRVAIARAVARKPSLILADEPTGNLDKDNALNILELLASFKDDNTSVIITTHATHLIEYEDYDKLIQMNGGNIYSESLGEAK
ncbi:cell division ATP-binding protein FtsE [Alkaliphilus peptidifermentans]|uniref:Cell division transport system ATP-binding protein n=1 Tax=Alkaliphilus peptidifermentans DSM 18978 TaxID=1120976 RepID=A0A1G5JS93_9FIRM|nr:ATP-binding cassette domain-containing protein [Alkaliphilus peptidifermentans]SCY91206.1 cell division transport system ATP-binding protein [Alkaliphilus peptidifermentans DSM 18978]